MAWVDRRSWTKRGRVCSRRRWRSALPAQLRKGRVRDLSRATQGGQGVEDLPGARPDLGWDEYRRLALGRRPLDQGQQPLGLVPRGILVPAQLRGEGGVIAVILGRAPVGEFLLDANGGALHRLVAMGVGACFAPDGRLVFTACGWVLVVGRHARVALLGCQPG